MTNKTIQLHPYEQQAHARGELRAIVRVMEKQPDKRSPYPLGTVLRTYIPVTVHSTDNLWASGAGGGSVIVNVGTVATVEAKRLQEIAPGQAMGAGLHRVSAMQYYPGEGDWDEHHPEGQRWGDNPWVWVCCVRL